MEQTSRVPSGAQDDLQAVPQESPQGELDEALVRQVADRVYRMLMQEMKYDQERLHMVRKKTSIRKGGR